MSDRPAVNRRALLISGLSAGAVAAVPATALFRPTASAVNRSRACGRTRSPSASPPATPVRTASSSGPGSPSPRSPTTAWAACRTGASPSTGRSPSDQRFATVVRRGESAAARPVGRTASTSSWPGCAPGREYWYRFRADGPRLAGRPHPHRPAAGDRRAGAGDVVRLVRPLRARLLHRVPAAGRGPARPGPAPGRLPVRVRVRHYIVPAATRATTTARRPRPWPTTGSGTRSTRPTPTCRRRTRSRRGWWSGTTTRWRTTGPTRCPRRPELPQPNFLARRAAAFRAYYENMPLRRASRPARHRHAAVPAGPLGPAGHLPPARHPAVPRRPGLRRRLQGLPRRGRPARAASPAPSRSVAARRLPRLRRPLGRARPAGLLRPAGHATRPGKLLQHGRLGRLRRPTATGSPVAGSTPGSATRWCSPATCTPTGRTTSSSNYDDPALTARSAPSWSARRSPPAATARTPTRPRTTRSGSTRTCASTTTSADTSAPRSPPTPSQADFRVVPSVTTRDAPVYTRATFVIEDRVPGLRQTYDRPRDG